MSPDPGPAHREQIKKAFEKLHQFLRDEEAARIAALKKEEVEKSWKVKKRIKEMVKDMSSLSDTITAIENKLRADDISFLQVKFFLYTEL